MTEGPWYRRRRFAVDVVIGTWYRRHRLAMDVAIAVFFVLLDTGATLGGATWWPAHPSPLAWAMLAVQGAVLGRAGRLRAVLYTGRTGGQQSSRSSRSASSSRGRGSRP